MAADLLVIAHLIFILFVVFGGLLVLRWPAACFVHIPAALWGALVEIQGWICPLTPLEQHFRAAAGRGPYSGSFIDHYIMPLVYPPGLTRKTQIYLGLGVVIINVAIYGYAIIRNKKRKHERPTAGTA